MTKLDYFRAGGCHIAAAGLFISGYPAAFAKDRPEPVVMEPSGPWQIDYANDSCRLSRLFGSGKDLSVFYLERYGPGDRAFTVVGGAPFARWQARKFSKVTTIQFGPGEAAQDKQPMVGSFSRFDPTLIFSGLSFAADDPDGHADYNSDPGLPFSYAITPAREAAVEWFSVKSDGGYEVQFALGSMGTPMAALRQCSEELVGHWGLDVDAQKNLTSPAMPSNNAGDWVKPDDYPSSLLRKGTQGIVRFRLIVSPQGKPESCHIQKSTRPEGFDLAVCKALIRRARFHPALDEEGQPVESYYINTVLFEIPD